MGSGKTRLGKLIAKENSLQFIDLDQYIENQEGLEVAEIFEKKGEAYFRELEGKCIEDILSSAQSEVVLSLGGGVMENHSNAALLLDNCFLVYLKFSPKVLKSRLENAKTKRPLLAGLRGDELEKFVADHLSGREKNYSRAHFIADNVMDIKERVKIIVEAYNQFK